MLSLQKDFEGIVELLTQRDRDFQVIINQVGNPPQWQRKPGFATLVQIILEQQVSLASAKATFKRLEQLVNKVTPKNLLSLNELQLKSIGFSRQKISYVQALALAIIENTLNLISLEKLDDLTIRNQLKKIKGIGDWTVDMYLIMALQRSDIFPSKDLAIAIAIKEIKKLTTKPTVQELVLIAEPWRPYRSVATQILWHYYLNR